MINYKKLFLREKSTIRDAMRSINQGALGIAFVVDKDETFIGTLSDGDIRRGLLNNLLLEDTIETIIFKEPVVCRPKDDRKEILKIAKLRKVSYIPIVNEMGKLLEINHVDQFPLSISKPNKVVLMVGGLGTRLRPLTEHTPKPMLEVGGKPILETIILNFKKYGFYNIILSVSYKAEMIQKYFQDGSSFGVNIEYVYEEQRMGTAGALSLMRDKLQDPFFVMNGDLLTNINFENMMDFHLKHHAMGTMGVREYDFQVPYGVVSVNDVDILSIKEKPIHHFFVSGGVYVFDQKVLDYIPDNCFYDMPTLFEKLIEEKEKSISFPIHDYWLDIGRIEEFEKANNEFHEVFDA